MTLTIETKSGAGEKAGTITLDDYVFGIEPNVPVLHQVITAQLAARRSGTQSTKTRAEVRGGGIKPRKQKGTGQSRQGSIRAAQWVGGGVALGPKPRSYAQRTPKKMIQLALRSALSDRAADNRVIVVDSFDWEKPNTKAAIAALAKLGATGKVLVVLTPEDGTAYYAFRNLGNVMPILASELNAYDIICCDYVIFTKETLPTSVAVDGEDDEVAPTQTAKDGE